jgi:hypothetical protein
MYSDSSHGVPDPASSLATLASSMDVLQVSIKESTNLLRLDLQQHTALQVCRQSGGGVGWVQTQSDQGGVRVRQEQGGNGGATSVVWPC